MNFFERHHDKIEIGAPSGCWLWSAGLSNKGYGTVYASGKTRKAHRVAYEAENGTIPEGLIVRHKCDVRNCVNPDHLLVGTHADNVRDREERGRRTAPKGRAHGMAKLTDAEVLLIRGAYIPYSREFGGDALARRFGVSSALVNFIVNRKIWTHL